MSVEVKIITPSRKELKKYVRFGIDLYKGNDCYVPPLILDEINTLRPDHNPAFDFCRAKSFMAFRDGNPVGRITGIINDVVNERSGHKDLRPTSSTMPRSLTRCSRLYRNGVAHRG